MATTRSTPGSISRIDGASEPLRALKVQPPKANQIQGHTLAQTSSRDARHTMICEAAYHRARQRGFAPGEEWQDWFEAEREVDALLDPDL